MTPRVLPAVRVTVAEFDMNDPHAVPMTTYVPGASDEKVDVPLPSTRVLVPPSETLLRVMGEVAPAGRPVTVTFSVAIAGAV